MTNILAAQSAEVRAKAETLLQQADRLLCESWNERMWADGGRRRRDGADALGHAAAAADRRPTGHQHPQHRISNQLTIARPQISIFCELCRSGVCVGRTRI
jgi:hypothetical protein